MISKKERKNTERAGGEEKLREQFFIFLLVNFYFTPLLYVNLRFRFCRGRGLKCSGEKSLLPPIIPAINICLVAFKLKK